MDILDQPYYRTTKNFARIIGRWPFQLPTQSLVIITVLWIILILQAIPQIIAVYMSFDNVDVLFEALSVTLVDFILAAKFFNASYRAGLIKNLFKKLQSNWTLLANNKERQILQYYSETGQLLANGYAVFLLASVVIFIMEPLVPRIYAILSRSNESVPLQFALPVEYVVFDKEDHYWLIIIGTSFFSFSIIFCVVACDCLFITLLQHICGQFAVLGYRIEHTPTGGDTTEKEKEVYSNSQKNFEDVSYQHLVSCIEMHARCLKFAEDLEDCFAMSFGVVVGLNLPMISLTGFQLITKTNTVQQILKSSTFAGGQMLHLFFDCYMSQKLSDLSTQIARSIANVDWYKYPIKSQKLLVIMTMKSQESCKLTAGKIIELSIESYAKMLKMAGSYFTMLLSFQ